MSKFDFSSFYGGYGDFAVNSQKFTKEQAINIFEKQTDSHVGNKREDYAISTAWVRHRAGVNEDGEPQVGWWLEYQDKQLPCVGIPQKLP